MTGTLSLAMESEVPERFNKPDVVDYTHGRLFL